MRCFDLDFTRTNKIWLRFDNKVSVTFYSPCLQVSPQVKHVMQGNFLKLLERRGHVVQVLAPIWLEDGVRSIRVVDLLCQPQWKEPNLRMNVSQVVSLECRWPPSNQLHQLWLVVLLAVGSDQVPWIAWWDLDKGHEIGVKYALKAEPEVCTVNSAVFLATPMGFNPKLDLGTALKWNK